jgi:hypothetical protein
MSDTIKGKIQNAGQAAADAAKKAGQKVKEGAEKTAVAVADAAKKVGEKVKEAGKSLKDKSGA